MIREQLVMSCMLSCALSAVEVKKLYDRKSRENFISIASLQSLGVFRLRNLLDLDVLDTSCGYGNKRSIGARRSATRHRLVWANVRRDRLYLCHAGP